MNLLQLKYAVEVAATASITKAAENLYMGQPNLSRAIRELEEELGVDLFRRTSRGIVPTAQGEAFLERARAVLRQMEALEQAVCRKCVCGFCRIASAAASRLDQLPGDERAGRGRLRGAGRMPPGHGALLRGAVSLF